MTRYRLTYFDIDGGRGEPVRIALHAAGVTFDDHRIKFAEFPEFRRTARFGAAPVLEIDGAAVTQSNALLCYAGRLAGLYPADPLQALYCDEVLGAMEDLDQQVGRSFGLKGEALKSAREALAEGWLPLFLRGLDGLLARGGGTWFADGRLTVADIKAFCGIGMLGSGFLDHIPADIVARHAPALADHRERTAKEAPVAAWYAGRG